MSYSVMIKSECTSQMNEGFGYVWVKKKKNKIGKYG